MELVSEHFFLFQQEVRIDKQLQSGLRVTVQLNKTQKRGEFSCSDVLVNLSNEMV